MNTHAQSTMRSTHQEVTSSERILYRLDLTALEQARIGSRAGADRALVGGLRSRVREPLLSGLAAAFRPEILTRIICGWQEVHRERVEQKCNLDIEWTTTHENQAKASVTYEVLCSTASDSPPRRSSSAWRSAVVSRSDKVGSRIWATRCSPRGPERMARVRQTVSQMESTSTSQEQKQPTKHATAAGVPTRSHTLAANTHVPWAVGVHSTCHRKVR